MARNEEPSVTLWACRCCTLVLANGECCDGSIFSNPWISHGGDGKEPLSAIPEGLNVSLGMMWEEHNEECPNRKAQRMVDECDCERQEFSWSSCDACGSSLGGNRHAFVIWYPKTEGSNNER